jgi:general stress protein YciG
METKKPKGFACMTPDRRSEIARMGGQAVPADKRTYSIDKFKASTSGKIGGSLSRKRAVTDREGGQ